MIKLFHKHNWYYALGDSKGFTGGSVREICFRRYCPKCKSHQEIENYNDLFRVKGEGYFGKPTWKNYINKTEE